MEVTKRSISAIYVLNDDFTRTASGQTREKHLNKDRFVAERVRVQGDHLRCSGKDNASFAMPFYTENQLFTRTGSGQT
jgi:hypothetical protein